MARPNRSGSIVTVKTAEDPGLAYAQKIQRHTIRVLFGAQVLSGAGLAAGITVGALLAQDMLGSTAFAGVPSLLFTAGAAGSAMAIGALSQRSGRRLGLASGYLAGAVGSLGVVLAAALDNVPMLFAFLVLYGAGSAANLQARYVGADLASPGHRGRAVAIVLVATTLGAVLGPNLASIAGGWATRLGAPALAGPFILAAGAYLVGALVLWAALRPDPLLVARGIAAHPVASVAGAPVDAKEDRSGLVRGTATMVVSQVVMVAIMTMTPVHMLHHGHSVRAIGVVIGVHVAAMYLPSPVSGWLVDRVGATPVAFASIAVLLAAGAAGAAVPAHSLVGLSVALGLLGLGWSLGLVSGTAMVARAVPAHSRASAQGRADFLIALAGAAGGALSGLVVARESYGALALGGGLLALALLPVLGRWGRRTSPSGVPS